MEKRLPADHVVLKHLPAFLAHANKCAEMRLRRIGVLDRPLAEISGAKRAALVAEAYGGKLLGGLGSLLADAAAPVAVVQEEARDRYVSCRSARHRLPAAERPDSATAQLQFE